MITALCIIIAILLIVIALLMAITGYFVGREQTFKKQVEEAVTQLFVVEDDEDPDEPKCDPDPANVEDAENDK